MRRSSFISGIALALLLSFGAVPADSARAADLTLYMRLKTISEKQVLGDVEPDIAAYVQSLVQSQYDDTLALDDISVAARAPGAFQGRCGARGIQASKCADLERQIRRLVEREERVRKLGRDLFLTTGSYEVPLSESLGKFAAVSPPLGSLLTIWESGSDRAVNPDAFVHTTAAPFPDPDGKTEDAYTELKDALDALVEDAGGPKEDLSELAAAVARYRFGYTAVRSEGSCDAAIGGIGELSQLTQRWCALEDELHDVWNHLHASLTARPLPPDSSEVVFFPTWLFKDINVVVWATNRDVGIEWEIPLEPVLPWLMDDREYQTCMEENNDDEAYCSSRFPPVPIPGGALLNPPDPPPFATGVCGMPLGSRGFLCQPIEQHECAIALAPNGSSNATGTGLYLTSCKEPILQTPVRMSFAGPDVCGVGGWRMQTEPASEPDNPGVQTGLLPTQCSNCSVDIYCSSSCPEGGAYTDARDASGRIGICIPETIQGSTAIFQTLILHELVHAQQTCSNPREILTGDLNYCCSSEYQAYLVQCIAFAEDGILQDMQVTHQGKRINVTPELCAATLSTLSCSSLGQCSESPIPPAEMKQAMLEAVERSKSRLNLPVSCADAVNRMDTRSKAILASLPKACTPECRSEFENTIGNNLCFIGQCIEQSWEEERIVPGRMSLNVGDEALPWDSCIGAEPAANTDLPASSLLMLPTLAFPPLPDYRPWDIANSTDIALCQLLGLPARTPPTLCAAEVSRQLSRPLSDPLDMMINLAASVEDQLDPAVELERMAPNVGTRYATSLYRTQLGALRRAFAEIFDGAAVMLEEISKTSFPEQACSRVDGTCPFLPSAP